jgi:hypothetical protein
MNQNPIFVCKFFFHSHYSLLWALACRTIPLHFSLSITNSLHLLASSTWRSLSTSSLCPFLGLLLHLFPSSSWVKIFLAILSSSILSRWFICKYCFNNYNPNLSQWPTSCTNFNTFITILYIYMFQAISCSSSGGQIVLIQRLESSVSVSNHLVHRLRKNRCRIAPKWPPSTALHPWSYCHSTFAGNYLILNWAQMQHCSTDTIPRTLKYLVCYPLCIAFNGIILISHSALN